MKNIKTLLAFFICFFVISLIALYAESQQKTDFKIGAKIIGVADPDYKEYSYIDMGSAHGVKPGDRFMVEGKYGKVMVEVVQAFQRMSAVKIVDSWLLNEGNSGEMIPASRYPKIRINKYVEKGKKDTVLASKKLTPKKSKPKVKVSATVEKAEKKKEVVKKEEKKTPEEVSTESLFPEESAEVLIPSFEGVPEEQVTEIPETEFKGDELSMEIPGEEMPVGEIDTALPGEETLPAFTESSEGAGLPVDTGMEPGLPADTGMEPGLPADTGMEPGLPADTGMELGLPADTGMEPGLPADTGMELGLPADTGMEPGLPTDTGTEPELPADNDLSVMPGDALPPMP